MSSRDEQPDDEQEPKGIDKPSEQVWTDGEITAMNRMIRSQSIATTEVYVRRTDGRLVRQ